MTRNRFGLALALLVLSSGAQPAGAAVFLVGAQLYSCNSVGTNGASGLGPGYQCSTNSATSHLSLNLRGLNSEISFLLEPGENDFFYITSCANPGSHACMNLFFADADQSYNPPYTFPTGIPGDLTVIAPTGGSTFSFPAAGINVQSYNASGSLPQPDAPYSGNESLEVGGETVTVTGFTVLPAAEGTFTVTVPEPASGALGAAAASALGIRRRSDRRRAASIG